VNWLKLAGVMCAASLAKNVNISTTFKKAAGSCRDRFGANTMVPRLNTLARGCGGGGGGGGGAGACGAIGIGTSSATCCEGG
jgi:hypothetical protein